MKRVCIVTTTRADWGLLMPLARSLRDSGKVELQIIAANMHLMERYGMTVNEIHDAGFTVDRCVPMDVPGDDDASRASAMAVCMSGMAKAFDEIRPDVVVLLGDRYEMLAVASTAAAMHIPIVHIAGGEISEGALDDSFRHAITKLSNLHLTATEPYRRRVIQMGEAPDTVVNTGAIGVWNALNVKTVSKKELEEYVGMNLAGDIALVTYHPATNDTEASPAERTRQLLDALDTFPEMKIVFTAPNNDAGGESSLKILRDYAAANPGRVALVESLGMVRYHSMLRIAAVVVGNSSSGLVEVPTAGIPTVDIGIRQRGRIAAPSVVHCEPDSESIRAAIAKALSPGMRRIAARKENPYFKPDTLKIMTDAVLGFTDSLPRPPKKFYDLP